MIEKGGETCVFYLLNEKNWNANEEIIDNVFN